LRSAPPLADGVPGKDRHEDIAVTNRYMHLTPGAKEQAIQALESGAENGARMAPAGAPGKTPVTPAG
jgi:hypothetical protein